MTDQMIEAVALRIRQFHQEPTKRPKWNEYRILARAAIMAMREPTEAMQRAAVREAGSPFEEAAKGVWKVMVETALME